MKINYLLNEDNTIKGYTVYPIDLTKPTIEINSVSDIVINYSKVIDGKLVNDFDVKEKLKELYNIG